MSPLNLSFLFMLLSAPLPNHGGTLNVNVWGSQRRLEPTQAASFAERAISSVIYEPLFEYHPGEGIKGKLANAQYSYRGTQLRITLKPGTRLHNTRELTATDVITRLNQLAQPGSLGQHVVWPIDGATQIAGGIPNAKLKARLGASPYEILIETTHPYPALPRLLSTLSSAINAEGLGTGPFLLQETGKKHRLAAFTQYRDGSPYVDEIIFRASNSPFEARSALRREEANIVFGLLDLDKKTARKAQRWKSSSTSPPQFVVLRVGGRAPVLQKPDVMYNLSSAIKRKRLSRKYLPGQAKPVSNLLGNYQKLPRANKLEPSKTRSLLFSSERSPGRRFAEQLQFDLLKLGVSVKIESLPVDVLDQRIASGDFEFALEQITLLPAAKNDPIARFHQLLELSARLGILSEVITPKDMSTFASSTKNQRLLFLGQFEQEIREIGKIITISQQVSRVWFSKTRFVDGTISSERIALETLELVQP